MADYLDHVRRLCAFLFMVAVGLVFVAIHAPASGATDYPLIYLLLATGLATGLFVYRFPWRRYDPNWFLLIGVAATGMLSLLISWTGGRESIFHPIFFFIVVASGAYYEAIPLAVMTVIASLGSLSYLLYEPATGRALLQSAFEIPTFFVVAFLCYFLYRQLERRTLEAARQSEVLALLRQIDQQIVTGADLPTAASVAVGGIRRLVPCQVTALGQVTEGDSIQWLAVRSEAGPASPELTPAQRQQILRRVRRRPWIGPLPLAEGASPTLCLAVGLSSAEKILGLLLLGRERSRPWREEEESMVAQVATELAVGMERARLAEQLAEVQAAAALGEMKEEFMQQVAHDLRSPLTALMAASDMLARGSPDRVRDAKMVGHVQSSARRLSETLDELLEVAQLEHAETVVEPVWLDLRPFLQEVVDGAFSPRQRERVQVEVAPDLLRVRIDRRHMSRALTNVIGNALKYSPENSPVRVVCRDEGQQVAIEVVDNGLGIPADMLDRVFDPFYRAPNLRRRGIPGTGLGLAITRQLVEAHGGQIRAESRGEGHGSTFVIALPKAQPPSRPADGSASQAGRSRLAS